MDKIEKYINSLYKDVNDNSVETEDLKQEMKNHLKETAKELQEKGINEEESIKIAIERFGEEFQIRNELAQVIKFQKFFAKKILIASLIFLLACMSLLITSHFTKKEFINKSNIMNAQINLLEDKLKTEGIDGVDKSIKDIFQDVENNQLTYVAIKELPQDFDMNKSTEVFPGKIKYSYPKKIESTFYGNRFGHEVTVNNMKYFYETGVKTSANTDYSDSYLGIAILCFTICWVLWIIWSIINVYRLGNLNTSWCILLVLIGILGYFIFSISRRKYNFSFHC